MYSLDYSRGASPLYLQIKAYIKDQITSEEYAYGTLIPTEPEYETFFGVSRMTVRQAINELQKEGYVRRIRGRGTEVIYRKAIEEELNHIQSFSDEMKQKGYKPGTQGISVEFIEDLKDAPEPVRELFPHAVLKLHRVRTADDEPLVVFISYLDYTESLPLAEEAYSESMYGVILARTGRSVTRVNETFSAIKATLEIAEALKIAVGDPVLSRVRLGFDQNNKLLEYTESYYRGDTYRYSIAIFDNKE